MKPEALKVNSENIPDYLKEKRQWVNWKWMQRDKDKWTKPPYNPKTGEAAKVNDPETWSDFESVLNAYQNGSYDGIGIVLKKDMGIIGFDFDHCIENNEVSPDVRAYIDQLCTYTEKSPSGTGIRAFAFGTFPEVGREGRKAGPYEVYAAGRYLTITGAVISASEKIEHREKEISAVYRAMFPEQQKKTRPEPRADNYRPPADQQALLEKAFQSKCGSEIQALYSGNWEAAGCPSQSEGDQKLCFHFAFWYDRDPAAIDQMFRSSGLYRDKWDRKTGKKTYGEMTIERAVSLTSQTYQDFIRDLKNSKAEGDSGDDEKKKTAAAWMEELNSKHAVVMLRGQLLILNEETDPDNGRPDITFSKVGDFKNCYANYQVKDPKTQQKKQVGNYWFLNENRRHYNGVTFKPEPIKYDSNGKIIKTNQKTGRYYNLWTGFGVEPKQGDWGLLRNHVRNIICGGNEEYLKWLLAWFARIIQDPGGERPGNAVVLLGKKGTGKGAFVEQFRYILGDHFMPVSRPEHITGRFNSHLKNLVMLFCDEGFWGGDKTAEGTLKRLITEATNPIEMKGQNVFPVDSHLNIVMATNEPWAVPASKDERRYFVLEVSEEYLTQYPDKAERDKKIFKPIWNQMNKGGREAMLYDLLHLDISEVNLRSAPRTPALMRQIERSMNPFERWWYEKLFLGENTDQGWEREVEKNIIFNDYKEFATYLGQKYKLTEVHFGRELKKACEGIETYRPGTGNQRPRYYRFPALEECRKEFQKQVNIEINWEDGI